MKLQSHVSRTALVLFLLAVWGFCLFPAHSAAQSSPVRISPVSWFDWSDFRADVGFRVFLARLGSVNLEGGSLANLFNSDQYSLTQDPEAFKEFWAILYIDRLGLRFHQEDPWVFYGQAGPDPVTGANILVSTLDVSGQRLGIDVDIIRYPVFKAGINFDYHNQPIRFTTRYYAALGGGLMAAEYFDGDEPLTFGAHGRVIPFRIREVPFTVQGRFRFPITIIPFFKRKQDAQITEFEISAGLRPNIWDTSLLGHTTISLGVNAGYRWDRLLLKGNKRVAPATGGPAQPAEATLNAVWQGAFFEAVLTF